MEAIIGGGRRERPGVVPVISPEIPVLYKAIRFHQVALGPGIR